MDAIWITWERQRRNATMAAAVGAQLHELGCAGNRLSRYLRLGVRTALLIARRRPDVVYYQNPSLALALLVVVLRRFIFTRMKVIGDFHNAGVYPPFGRGITPWLVRSSDLVIVTNDNLARVIRAWGGAPVAIPDPIPTLEGGAAVAVGAPGACELLFICSWAEDEPIANVLAAARLIATRRPQVRIRITGRPRPRMLGAAAVPDNVTLTGFLPESDFVAALRAADGVMVLTTRDDCMVCGAYEGVAAEKPLILSGNAAMRGYFTQGALFTDNSVASIVDCVLHWADGRAELAAQVAGLRREMAEREGRAVGELLGRVGLGFGVQGEEGGGSF